MYFTGTRPGEAMALKFSDLYFNEISINKEISEHCINGSGVIDSTKSISSYRTVFIDKKLKKDLLKLKKYYQNIYSDVNFDYYILEELNRQLQQLLIDIKLKLVKKLN